MQCVKLDIIKNVVGRIVRNPLRFDNSWTWNRREVEPPWQHVESLPDELRPLVQPVLERPKYRFYVRHVAAPESNLLDTERALILFVASAYR